MGNSLEKTIRLLGLASSQAAATDAADAAGQADGSEPLRGYGTGGDGLVKAEVGAYGQLESLEISPTLLRAGTTVIADHVREAVRAAQDDERRRRERLSGEGPPDLASLERELESVAEEAWRGFGKMIDDLDALTRRLDRG